MTEQPDIEVTNEGTIFLFAGRTTAGQEWLEQYIGDAQRYGQSFVVEHGYAADVAQGALDYGLVVE